MIVFLQNLLGTDQIAAVLAGLGREGGEADAGNMIASSLMSQEPFANAMLPTALTPSVLSNSVLGRRFRSGWKILTLGWARRNPCVSMRCAPCFCPIPPPMTAAN